MTTPLPGISVAPNVGFVSDFKIGYPVDQIRLYDVAVEKWVNSFIHPHNKGSLFAVVATPERAYAEQKQIVNQSYEEQVRRRDKIITEVKPAVSIARRNIVKDQTRWKRAIINKCGYVDTANREEVFQWHYPRPITIDYTLEFESINRTTHNYLMQFFHLQFDDRAFYLPINFSSVHESYPCYDIRFELQGIEDTSDLESAENQRNMRFTLDMLAIAWLFMPVRIAKTIHKINFDICDAQEKLDEISIGIS